MDWFKAQHRVRFSLSKGDEFEDYVAAVLQQFHSDYINPTPKGSLGDGGSDGFAESGRICYACYGSRAQTASEAALKRKVQSDFERATTCWAAFTTWRFITNCSPGPIVTQYIISIQQEHDGLSDRPIEIRIWNEELVWTEVLTALPFGKLNHVFPGAPGLVDIELEDLIPLLDTLSAGDKTDNVDAVAPVPFGKMEYNRLPEAHQMELNTGRRYALRINKWYQGVAAPDLHDRHAARFRRLYEQYRSVVEDAGALLERIYVALAGNDFRMDQRRANAAYAVVAYFFDECHIFEEPPADNMAGGETDVVADQGD